jgi:hypothetical protein
MRKQKVTDILNPVLLTLFLFLANAAFCQPAIEWAKCFGGSGDDNVYSIQQTKDSGYVVAGYNKSTDGEVTGNNGNKDFWIVKMDQSGDLQWEKSLGGSSDECANSVKQTIDGGYIVAGWTTSNDSMVSGNHGMQDMWIVKLGNTGELEWQKCLGGSNYDIAYSIQQTYDTGYIVAGVTGSGDGDVTMHHGNSDYWLVKLNSSGVIQWQKCLGGSGGENAYSVQQTSDSGYIVAGESASIDGDVTGNHGNDCWIVKLNSLGEIQWEKCYGGTHQDEANDIKQTTDGGYVFAGSTNSTDGDVSGLHGQWYSDFWVVKISDAGAIQWQKCLGGDSLDIARSVQQTPDGGYIVSGETMSINGDVAGNQGQYDAWIVKVDNSGSIQWQKCVGGTHEDSSNGTWVTIDGGIISTGCTNSNDGDVSGNHGGWDFGVVKMASESSINENTKDYPLQIFPNPATSTLNIECPQSQILNVTLFNLMGEQVMQRNFAGTKESIEISSLPSGMYIVKVSGGDWEVQRKVIKE